MTVWCNVHHAPFKEGVTRWCKRSNPGDTCEVDKSSLPPRRLPTEALLMLGSLADKPGAVTFLLRAKQEGFGIDQPGDHDLSDERWQEVANARVRALVMSFDMTANGSAVGRS